VESLEKHKRRAFDLIRYDKVAKKLRQSPHGEMLLCAFWRSKNKTSTNPLK